jgi:hypothetical protein
MPKLEPGGPGSFGRYKEALKGDPGESAYEVAVRNGFVGSENDWIAWLKGEGGDPGDSDYDVAVAHGFAGNELVWLVSLIGQPGESA